jgi:hypothetical protein
MKKLILAILGLFLFMSGSAHAGASGGWYNGVTIKYVYAGSIGNRIAITVSPPINVGTCPVQGELALDQNNPYFFAMYTIIMTAKVKALPVNVYTDGTCSAWGVVLTDIYLQ